MCCEATCSLSFVFYIRYICTGNGDHFTFWINCTATVPVSCLSPVSLSHVIHTVYQRINSQCVGTLEQLSCYTRESSLINELVYGISTRGIILPLEYISALTTPMGKGCQIMPVGLFVDENLRCKVVCILKIFCAKINV